ncbi:MAG: sigma-70 family RNA polymerase sigma factor, partial [Angustibacter sp.]
LAVSRWRKARNALVSMGRAHREESSPDPTEHFGIREEIVQALQQLPKGQRTVVVLHYLCDLDISSIAEEIGGSVGSVKTQLHRGRKSLAEILAPGAKPPSEQSRVVWP